MEPRTTKRHKNRSGIGGRTASTQRRQGLARQSRNQTETPSTQRRRGRREPQSFFFSHGWTRIPQSGTDKGEMRISRINRIQLAIIRAFRVKHCASLFPIRVNPRIAAWPPRGFTPCPSVVDAFRERAVFVTLRRAKGRGGEQEEIVLRSLSTLRSTATEDGRLLAAIPIAFFRFKQIEIQPAADPGSTIFPFAVLPFQRLRLRGRCKRA